MNPIIAPVVKIAEVIAVWLDPERKEKAILRNAIYAAEQIIATYEKTGEYRFYTDAHLEKMRVHFKKQLNAWKDGSG